MYSVDTRTYEMYNVVHLQKAFYYIKQIGLVLDVSIPI